MLSKKKVNSHWLISDFFFFYDEGVEFNNYYIFAQTLKNGSNKTSQIYV